MPNVNPPDTPIVTRRRLLGSSGSAIGLLGLGSAPAAAHSSDSSDEKRCPEATLEPEMVHYDESIHETCSDDHPSTEALQAAVGTALEESYPTVGALIDAGFVPYFDFMTGGDWSHWINPAFVGDDTMLDPRRPESILVDNTWWRPIGVMFIATQDGDPVDPPPTIYTDEDEPDGGCTPWHAHVGFPGRYSWWKYRKVYETPTTFPCRTPWMMHVWRYPHEKSIYAHGAPEERGGPPAEPAGFDTAADPNEETLGPEHLPDMLRRRLGRF